MHGIKLDNIDFSDEGVLIIVGGSHGAGKSTFCRELLNIRKHPYLTPEEIKKELCQGCKRSDILKLLRNQVALHINNGTSFYFEHVMSGHYVDKLIRTAKENKFKVHLVYIDIQSSGLALKRINHRIQSAGHDVEREKIGMRLIESRKNFNEKYKEMADSWDLYNNDEAEYRLVASFNQFSNTDINLEAEFKRFTKACSS